MNIKAPGSFTYISNKLAATWGNQVLNAFKTQFPTRGYDHIVTHYLLLNSLQFLTR